MQDEPKWPDVAKAGLEFLNRVELKGTEVSAFILVNRLLGQVMAGELLVVLPPVKQDS